MSFCLQRSVSYQILTISNPIRKKPLTNSKSANSKSTIKKQSRNLRNQQGRSRKEDNNEEKLNMEENTSTKELHHRLQLTKAKETMRI